MFNLKYHQYFPLLAIATFLQAISFSWVLTDAPAQPRPKPTPIKVTVPGGVRSPNSKCTIVSKDSQTPDRVSLGEASPFNSLPVKLQKIVTYSQSVGWVNADSVRKNVADYKLARITNLKVLADFERLSLFGWGDLRGEGDSTEFCAFVETK